MKKRIISLILVVAMAFLTLTGCAYSYAKDDMSKYATLDTQAFYNALQALGITDGDFGTDEDARKVKVQDAIAQAILKVTDTNDKKYEGKLDGYDALYFCYYAVDDFGNVLYAANMEEKDISKLNNVQLGLSTLEGFNQKVAEGVLALDDVKDYIYSTSAVKVVGEKDVVSVSYVKTWMDGETEKSETVNNFYYVVSTAAGTATKEFSAFLLGKQVGTELGEITVNETVGEETKAYTYKDVKVESIVKDNSTDKVESGDKVYVTYTFKFDAKTWYNAETKEYNFPEAHKYLDKSNIDEEGFYKQTMTLEYNVATADVTLPETATAEEKAAAKTFLGQLVGMEINSTAKSFTIEKDQTILKDQTVKVDYSNVKVNWVVNSEMKSFSFKYTPYTEALNAESTNKKTETAVNGQKIILNGVELTYYVFPVYYLDVQSLNTELVVTEFYSALAATQTAEHEHTEEEHEHTTEYVFSALNKNFKNGEKTLASLVDELAKLYGSSSAAESLLGKEKALSDALTALTTAQSKLAADTGASSTDTATLRTNKDKAYETYMTAKKAVDEYQKKVDEKIAEILACKDGETALDLVADYEKYQYDTLEDAYKSDLNTKVASKIIEYINKNVKFEGNLNKKAVKEAYNAIMNEYKNDFYEGKYSASTSSSTSTSTETNYKHYNGDFNAYLIDKVTSGKGDMNTVKETVMAQAEATVKEIIIIYVFAEAIEAQWDGADVMLTKEEKKNIKTNLENTALLYQQYGLSYTYNLESTYHAQQFDKALNYLLEQAEASEDSNTVVYKHIAFTTEAAEK